jgi:hypothetical protein
MLTELQHGLSHEFSVWLVFVSICISFFVLNFILSFLHLLTCIYIIWAIPTSNPSSLGRTCYALLFSDFVAEKT